MKLFLTAVLVTLFSHILPAQNTYWWNDKVFYEIFVRSYFDSDGNGIGDFKGLMKKLDYLNDGNDATTTDLGITALWLMPIMDSPSYHGYDVTDYRKIEPDFGTNADFKAFVDSAHARGIKIIIDLVLNHSSSNNPWFTDSRSGINATHRNWYRWSATNPGSGWHSYGGYYYYGVFGSGMPDINYFEPAVKTEIFDIAKYWLQTVNVDGFRLDAAKYICEEGNITQNAPSTYEFWKDFRTSIKRDKTDAFSIGEVWSSTSQVKPYVNGTGLDICFEFDLAGSIISSVSSSNPANLINQFNNVVMPAYPFLQYGTFLSNHDQQRVYSQLGSNINKAKLAASILLTLPGVPFIYYGEELGMTSATDDPSKRTPMQWTSGPNAGFTTGNPWKPVNANYTTNNVAAMSADSNSLLSLYKKLIHIRNGSLSLREGNYYPLSTAPSSIYAFARYSYCDDNIIFVIHNFSSTAVSNPNFYKSGFTGMPVGTYKLTDLLTNQDAGQLIIKSDGSYNCIVPITLPGFTSAILKATIITAVDDKYSPEGFILQQNYPNPFNPSTKISFQLPQSGNVKLTVFNTLGQEVKTLLNGHMEKGFHSIEFNAADLDSGIYFYRIQTGSIIESRKMILIK